MRTVLWNKTQSRQSDSDSEWLFQHVSSRAHLDQDREVWSLIQPQTGQKTISSVIFICTPALYWPKWATADRSTTFKNFSLTFRSKKTFHQLSCTLKWSQARWRSIWRFLSTIQAKWVSSFHNGMLGMLLLLVQMNWTVYQGCKSWWYMEYERLSVEEGKGKRYKRINRPHIKNKHWVSIKINYSLFI